LALRRKSPATPTSCRFRPASFDVYIERGFTPAEAGRGAQLQHENGRSYDHLHRPTTLAQVAGAAAFLAGGMTGTFINVTGGMVAD
jgi:hypothetical protein